MYDVMLTYKNGSTWYAGQFDSKESAQKWIDNEKIQNYWDSSTKVKITKVKG